MPKIPDLSGKLVAMRIDINSPVEKGKVRDNARIKAHGRSIAMLKRMGARVVALAHQGRKGGKDFVSLKNHVKLLERYAGKMGFVGFDFDAARKTGKGKAVLMENVRFLERQEELSSLSPDYFMLDAFSVAHRKEYSVTGFDAESLPGPVFSMEVSGIRDSRKQSTFLLGGAKEREVLDIVRARKDSMFLLGGVAGAKIAAAAYGLEFGERKYKRYANMDNVFYPVDFAVGEKKRVETRSPEEMPKDIGRETIKMFSAILKASDRIVFSKPLGMYENRAFAKGTRELYRLLSSLNSERMGGGGNTRDAIRRFRISEASFTYLSLSGGAFLEYAAGKTLPGMKRLVKDGWDEGSIANAWKDFR